MARSKEVFICQNCAASSPKWQGQCAACGEWNTLVAEVLARNSRAPRATPPKSGDLSSSLAAEAIVEVPRLPTGSTELDRVLGGGLVPGSVTLIGGDPGIGKSTLMLQAAAALNGSGAVLYATGEESLKQVALRARRLGLEAATARLIAETGVENIVAAAAGLAAHVLIVDSIQTMYSERVETAPGAVSQLRECTAELVRFAKLSGTAVLLVGHVTKEGQIAGPRVLEHMVDTVLYFESDTGSRYRVLRSVKNRFGAANEIGVFAMLEQGLREVTNPSAIFLSRHAEPVPGSVITVMREGTRRHCRERQSAPRGRGHRCQSLDHAAGGRAPTRWTAAARPRCIRQCGRRRAPRRDGRGSCHRHGRTLQPDGCTGLQFAHRLWRIGSRGRNSPGAVRRRALTRGCETWL
jgi:DNA repair protein RadA/Sms